MAIVTSFTVAHSITLVASTAGLAPSGLWFPPLIESLIALSIVYMAFETIVAKRHPRRWLLAFGFGLIHGFGFSLFLRDSLQFAGAHLATSLFSFNLGVELGQLLVVGLAVPVLSLLFRRVPERRARRHAPGVPDRLAGFRSRFPRGAPASAHAPLDRHGRGMGHAAIGPAPGIGLSGARGGGPGLVRMLRLFLSACILALAGPAYAQTESADVPGERTARTQPIPSKPLPYAQQGLEEEDLIDYTPARPMT